MATKAIQGAAVPRDADTARSTKRGASGGGGSNKKRAKATGNDVLVCSSAAALFFMCPGAGGELAADKPGEAARSIKTLLAEIGDVAGPMDNPPMGREGCPAKAMAAFQEAVEAAVAAHPGRDVWLASQSFGGRLAVHTMIGGIENRDATGKPKPWTGARPLPAAVKGIIAFGYPLHHAKQNRAAPLLELPAGTRIMFVMGEKDDMALGKPVNKSLLTGARRSTRSAPSPRTNPMPPLSPRRRRLPLGTGTIAQMAAADSVEVHWVPGGGHNPLDVPKTKRAKSNAKILEAVRRFVA